MAIYALIVAVVLLIIVVAILVHKVRRVHLAAFQLLSDTSAIKRETDALWGQLQSLHALERLLATPLALPSMRGWAGSPDFLLRLAEEILARRPSTVLECSSGVSTVISARALQLIGAGHVYSLEHDSDYAAKTRNLLKRYGLEEWGTVIDAPLIDQSGSTWYSLAAVPPDLPPIDILVVDGPPSATGPLARYPALPLLIQRMAPAALIVVDDAARDDEQAMLTCWRHEYPDFVQSDAYCEKGCVLVERKP